MCVLTGLAGTNSVIVWMPVAVAINSHGKITYVDTGRYGEGTGVHQLIALLRVAQNRMSLLSRRASASYQESLVTALTTYARDLDVDLAAAKDMWGFGARAKSGTRFLE